MSANLNTQATVLPATWEGALRDRGFAPQAGGYTRDSIRLAADARWLTFEYSGIPEETPVARLGAPGLWTRQAGGRAAFDLPRTVLAEDQSDTIDSLSPSVFEACLDWILASSRGELPAGWEAPAQAEVQSWMPANALTLQQGPLLRQGELILVPGRWAIRFPVAAVPAQLPPAREYYLGELLADARAHWRMVRLEVAQLESERGLVCEVDLSGAPHLENLFLAGLEAARQAVLWLAESTELVTNANLALQSFELCYATATERKV